MRYSIYTLTNPLTNEIFYVGKAVDLKTRFKGHLNLSAADNKLKNNIIEFILHNSAMPIIEELDFHECIFREDEDYVHELEMYWIQQLKSWGISLINNEGLKSKPKYYRKYSHILEESTFEIIVKTIVRRWDKLNNVYKQIVESTIITEDERSILYQHLTDAWNECLSYWNNKVGLGFKLDTDISWLSKRPYSTLPNYVTDYTNSKIPELKS